MDVWCSPYMKLYKKTVFDILGVVYHCTVSNLNQKTAEMTMNSCLLNRAVVTL